MWVVWSCSIVWHIFVPLFFDLLFKNQRRFLIEIFNRLVFKPIENIVWGGKLPQKRWLCRIFWRISRQGTDGRKEKKTKCNVLQRSGLRRRKAWAKCWHYRWLLQSRVRRLGWWGIELKSGGRKGKRRTRHAITSLHPVSLSLLLFDIVHHLNNYVPNLPAAELPSGDGGAAEDNLTHTPALVSVTFRVT